MSARHTPIGGVIVLAAGRARRFGSDKRAHRLADGLTLLEHSVQRYAGAFDHCIVVIRPDDPDPQLAAVAGRLPCLVRAAAAEHGMGHSLAAGAEAAQEWTYAFVALADMPWVTHQTLDTLRTAMEQALAEGDDGVIVQPVFAGRPGHPVGFSASLLDELRALEGDTGARSVVLAHPLSVRQVAVDDPGVQQDVDTPDQVARPC